jgi:hypothetical protein
MLTSAKRGASSAQTVYAVSQFQIYSSLALALRISVLQLEPETPHDNQSFLREVGIPAHLTSLAIPLHSLYYLPPPSALGSVIRGA